MNVCKKSVFLAVLLIAGFAGSSSAELAKRTVQSQGSGTTLNQAIYDAIHEAVARVNGESIETRQQLDSVSATTVDNDKAERHDAEVMQQKVKTATKGVIDGYEVLAQDKNADGLWDVTLSVTVVKFISHDTNRKRIAIFPLRIGGGKFIVDGKTVDSEKIERITTQNLVSTLVQSRRFTVLDREYIKESVSETDLALSENTPVAEMARLGQQMVADYIMVGSLEDFGYSEKVMKMQSSGRELVSRKGHCELSIRLIDVATKEIVFSDFLKIQFSDDDLQRYGVSLRDEGAETGIAIAVADEVGRKILDTVYPLMVVAVSKQNITIGQGGSQIKVGDKYELYMYGDMLTDPYTQEVLGREETLVGLVEVTRVNPKQTIARVIESNMDLMTQFEQTRFICRGISKALVNKEAERQERRKERDSKRKKRDNDW